MRISDWSSYVCSSDLNGYLSPPPAPMSQRGTVDRWSLSSWLLYRPDHGNASLANAGQLGASQVGERLAYDLSPKAAYSLAMHARVTSALQSPQIGRAHV